MEVGRVRRYAEKVRFRHRGGAGRRAAVALYGDFGTSNLGNEATLEAILSAVSRRRPAADVVCICTNPRVAAPRHRVEAVPVFAGGSLRAAGPTSLAGALVRKALRVALGVLGEPLSWAMGFHRLGRVELMIVPGTGLLTDAYGLFGWGTYGLLKWSLLAKARSC